MKKSVGLQNGTMHHQNELVLQILNTIKHSGVSSVELAPLKKNHTAGDAGADPEILKGGCTKFSVPLPYSGFDPFLNIL